MSTGPLEWDWRAVGLCSPCLWWWWRLCRLCPPCPGVKRCLSGVYISSSRTRTRTPVHLILRGPSATVLSVSNLHPARGYSYVFRKVDFSRGLTHTEGDKLGVYPNSRLPFVDHRPSSLCLFVTQGLLPCVVVLRCGLSLPVCSLKVPCAPKSFSSSFSYSTCTTDFGAVTRNERRFSFDSSITCSELFRVSWVNLG